MSLPFVALQWNELSFGILIAILLAGGLLVPYLIKEIRGGKAELGPVRRLFNGKVVLGPPGPSGAGDNNPGRRGDPAPGMPDAQANPYGDRAQRKAPHIKS